MYRDLYSLGCKTNQNIYLCHFFSVGFWVERSFSQKNWVFLGSYTQLVVEGVMPDLKFKKISGKKKSTSMFALRD